MSYTLLMIETVVELIVFCLISLNDHYYATIKTLQLKMVKSN